jgi:Putative transmembrane protein (PGPGW)
MFAAERELAAAPESPTEVRRGVVHKAARLGAGLALIVAGTVCLVIPGPGLVMIFAGLSLLPFRWAERTVQLIRRRTPGLREK